MYIDQHGEKTTRTQGDFALFVLLSQNNEHTNGWNNLREKD